jgi:hypothetical protein
MKTPAERSRGPTVCADRLEDEQLPHLALQLALTTHAGIPDGNAIDHLAEAEKVFARQQSKRAAAPTKKTAKKAARKPTATQGKATKKKTTKRLAA